MIGKVYINAQDNKTKRLSQKSKNKPQSTQKNSRRIQSIES